MYLANEKDPPPAGLEQAAWIHLYHLIRTVKGTRYVRRLAGPGVLPAHEQVRTSIYTLDPDLRLMLGAAIC